MYILNFNIIKNSEMFQLYVACKIVVCVHVLVYVSVWVCVFRNAPTVRGLNTHTHTDKHTHTHIHTHTHKYHIRCTHIHMYIYVYT